jgi:glycosyltransferase involved in cell wall biosynthesis
MGMKEKLTIVIPSKNESDILYDCLQFLYNQTDIDGVRVIVADVSDDPYSVGILYKARSNFKDKLKIEVIKGATKAIQNIDYIISEISSIELYKGTAKVKALNEVLGKLDFTMVASELNRSTGWGEALYLRNSLLTTEISHKHEVVGKRYPKGRMIRTVLIIFGFKKLGRTLKKNNF